MAPGGGHAPVDNAAANPVCNLVENVRILFPKVTELAGGYIVTCIAAKMHQALRLVVQKLSSFVDVKCDKVAVCNRAGNLNGVAAAVHPSASLHAPLRHAHTTLPCPARPCALTFQFHATITVIRAQMDTALDKLKKGRNFCCCSYSGVIGRAPFLVLLRGKGEGELYCLFIYVLCHRINLATCRPTVLNWE